MSSVRNIRQRKNPNNMNVTVIVVTGLEVREQKRHWWSNRTYTDIHQRYSRTFPANPYGTGEKPSIREGEVINLNPGGQERVLYEVREIRHIDENNVELVVYNRYREWFGSMDRAHKARREFGEFTALLQQINYRLQPSSN